MTDFDRKTTEILGVKVDFFSMDEVVEKITEWIKSDRKKYLVTPNPEIITYAQKETDFKDILNQADLAIPDGRGILWAMGIKEVRGKKERVTGSGLMLELCRLAPKYGWKIGLIGGGGGIGRGEGKKGVAERAAETLRKQFPGIKIVLAESGGEIGIKGESEGDEGIRGEKEMDILFVAFGFPKQEYWIYKNKDKFPAKVFIPVGGAFDYISGKVKRAPQWMHSCGLEWLYRLIKEPWRIKRQITGAKFFFWVLKEKLL